MAAIYERLANRYDFDALFGLKNSGINLPFAAHTFNLGPQAICDMHKDHQNMREGWCPVFVVGDFDYTRGGHFVMREPKVILEVQPGDIVLFMSAAITHGNCGIFAGEERMSWTCYMSGHLMHWMVAGERPTWALTTRQCREFERDAAQWNSESWAAVLTYDDLQAYYSILE